MGRSPWQRIPGSERRPRGLDQAGSQLEGRKRFGRITIANSDAGASAMTESAIEQGYRATQEFLRGA
jgi:hypothetical protein